MAQGCKRLPPGSWNEEIATTACMPRRCTSSSTPNVRSSGFRVHWVLNDELRARNAFALSLAEKENRAGFIGDGTSTCSGIRGIVHVMEDGSQAGGVVEAATPHNTFGEIDATDLANLMGRLGE